MKIGPSGKDVPFWDVVLGLAGLLWFAAYIVGCGFQAGAGK